MSRIENELAGGVVHKFFNQIDSCNGLKLSNVPREHFIASGTDGTVFRFDEWVIKVYQQHFELCASGNYLLSKHLHIDRIQRYIETTNLIAALCDDQAIFVNLPERLRLRINANPVVGVVWSDITGCMVSVSQFVEGPTFFHLYTNGADEQNIVYQAFQSLSYDLEAKTHHTGINVIPVNSKVINRNGSSVLIVTDICSAVNLLR